MRVSSALAAYVQQRGAVVAATPKSLRPADEAGFSKKLIVDPHIRPSGYAEQVVEGELLNKRVHTAPAEPAGGHVFEFQRAPQRADSAGSETSPERPFSVRQQQRALQEYRQNIGIDPRHSRVQSQIVDLYA